MLAYRVPALLFRQLYSEVNRTVYDLLDAVQLRHRSDTVRR